MDFSPLEVIRIRNCILTVKEIEGEQIQKSWARFKELIAQGPNHGISNIVILDCLYINLFPVNKQVLDQLILGEISQLPYIMDAQLLDHMDEAEREREKDVMISKLRTQMDELIKKVMNIKSQCKRKDKSTPLSGMKVHRDKKVENIEEILSNILIKLSEQDSALEEIKEDTHVMKHVI